MAKKDPPKKLFLERYMKKKDRHDLGGLTGRELLAYHVISAGFESDPARKAFFDFQKKSLSQVHHDFESTKEILTQTASPLQENILKTHYNKKFSQTALNRSELYYTLQGITDFDSQADTFHRDVAFALEAFDMVTYIENDVYDCKNGYTPGNEKDYFSLSGAIMGTIKERLFAHGKNGKRAFSVIKSNYDKVHTFQENVKSGVFPNLYDLKTLLPAEIENLYQQRLNGFDTSSVVLEVVIALNPERQPMANKFAELGKMMQKLNDADDIGTHRGHAKTNAGADFNKGEITTLTRRFHQFPLEDQTYIKTRLNSDLQAGDSSKIDEILLRNGVYQACVADLRCLSKEAVHTMSALYLEATEKKISELEFGFLFKKLNVFVDNKIITNLEDKIADYEHRKASLHRSL